ncbi:Uncharacterized protein TPAR_01739 [Tolypocladium paradoxum]|uniref:Glycoprotein X n=1 Tax=Tolypocladium paradoxum TaxID=94208 RepID=A0A2S4L6M0_9HYPO|nr:Uncharacterized protein TPAR_01739 [Tolypocladium paradoxum]
MRFGAALWALGALASTVFASPDNGTVEASLFAPDRMLRVEMFSADKSGFRLARRPPTDSNPATSPRSMRHRRSVTPFMQIDRLLNLVTEQVLATTTQHDISTKLEYTTQFVTTTTTSTFENSFPVTVTAVKNCVPKSNHQPSRPTAAHADRRDAATFSDMYCETITTTEWRTTTTTTDVTVIKPSVSTKTMIVPAISVVPTTVEDTRTVTQVHTTSTTVWLPTTYTQTTSFSTKYPVTITSDHTVVTTSISTAFITTVSTFTTSYPVVTQVTKLITETATVTAPGQLTTLTLPGETRTLPGSTIVSTLTKELPGQTITVTRGGTTFTTTLPGTTAITTTTVVIGPTTVSVPARTATVSPIFAVTVCPSPTGSSAPLPTDSDLTLGCKPGFVCNPPKPNGCNLWPGPPPKEFLCHPQDCIRSPPFTNTTWKKNETGYYPPSYAYFNLNPEAFGLSYDIFEFKARERVEDGHTKTITTGNWASQTSLSDWPRASDASTRVPPPPYGKEHERRELHIFGKRAVTPSVCFDDCNNAWLIAQSIGKTDELCKGGSSFREGYNACAKCILDNTGATKDTIRDYVEPEFAQYLDFCNGKRPRPTASSATGPDSAVTSLPPVGTSTQAQTSQTDFTPIGSTTSKRTTRSTAAKSTPSNPSVNTTTSAAEPSSTTAPSSSNAATTTKSQPRSSQSVEPSSAASTASQTEGTGGANSATSVAATGPRTAAPPMSAGRRSSTERNGSSGGSSASGTAPQGSSASSRLPGGGSETPSQGLGKTTNSGVASGTGFPTQPAVVTAAAPRLATSSALMMVALAAFLA